MFIFAQNLGVRIKFIQINRVALISKVQLGRRNEMIEK